MSVNQNSSKPRQLRLRASCDGCFLAKVKCNKTRPICSRCLRCGTDCVYSPSSRSGKPKADGNRATQTNHSPRMSRDISLPEDSTASAITYTTQAMTTDSKHTTNFSLDADWSSPPDSTDERIHRHSLSSGVTSMMVDETSSEADSSGANT
jgi:hypothetical protein